jgi:hypothetical protein
MRGRLLIAFALCVGFMGASGVAAPAESQQKGTKAAVAKQDRVEGSIHMTDKAAKTVTVRLAGRDMQRQVLYDDHTKFTFRNKPASVDEVQDGRRVICLGKFNDKLQLVASRIDVRDK